MVDTSTGHSSSVRQSPVPSRSAAKIALAHDWLVGYRGGEAVLEAIAELVAARFDPAGLYTMFASGGLPMADRAARSGQTSPLASFGPPVTSVINSVPGAAGRLRRWFLPLFPFAVATLNRALARRHAQSPIDLLVSTSSAAVKGLKGPSGAAGRRVPHLCYCHTPARYLWSQTAEYGQGTGGGLRSAGLRMFGPSLRRWDRRTSAHVTRFLANSTHTAREIKRCYGREADVVFPPVDTEFFAPDPHIARGEHWLYVGALEPYKRVDLAIAAANQSRRPLVIVGGGTQETFLRGLAGPTVRFLGRIDDEALRDEYRRAAAVVFPQVEDFGIVAVESQACGTPVVAFAAGGALDTVNPGATGWLFDQPSPESLLEAMDRCPRPNVQTAMACRIQAERFSRARFEAAMERHIRELLTGQRTASGDAGAGDQG